MEINLVKITCCECHVTFWITEGHDTKLLRSKESFYCPNGHMQSYVGKTEAQKLKEMKTEKDRYESNYNKEVNKNYHLDMSNRGLKGNISKLKKKLGDKDAIKN